MCPLSQDLEDRSRPGDFSSIMMMLQDRTFHLQVGKATVTFQDIVVILGLSDAQRVTSHLMNDWCTTSYKLLGVMLDACSLDEVRLRLWWL